MNHTLNKKYLITGTITALSGLHIGGTDEGLSIGNTDATVIKHPLTNSPYIPGSSIKGKMRSLFELSRGEVGSEAMGAVKNGPTNSLQTLSARIFGNAVRSQKDQQRPSRVIVRDALLSKTNTQDYAVLEIKTEVVIDRITSRAMPRSMERVPSGAIFDLEIVVNVFAEDKEEYLQSVLTSLLLVQDDYLGGKGSRGSGQVSFQIDKIEERTKTFYENPQSGGKDVTTDYVQDFSNLFQK